MTQPGTGGRTGGIPLIGYADPLSGRPGDTIEFKVSSDFAQPYRAQLVRIVCADPNPAGPGLREEPVAADINRAHRSRRQWFYPGSHAIAPVDDLFHAAAGFTLMATVWPTLPALAQNPQGILSCRTTHGGGVDLYLSEDGECGVSLDAGDGRRVSVCAGEQLRARQWYMVWASFDPASGLLGVGQTALHGDRQTHSNRAEAKRMPLPQRVARVVIAACDGAPVHAHFNGKIEMPMIFGHPLEEPGLHGIQHGGQLPHGLLARWDFSRGISSTRIEDTGPGKFHGKLVNLPARAMTGSNWDGREMCWRHAPEQYGAIHFHDDDIYDFNWETDFRFVIPQTLRSGVYAVRLRCADAGDAIPFFVCPPKARPSRPPKAKLCVLASTFTYTVYGNHARPNFTPAWHARMAAWRAYPHNPAEHREYGLSTYNHHRDGSGICHASHRRPLLTMRPGYLTFGEGEGSGLRHLQADTHLLAWLEQNGIEYDLITDRELHEQGVDAIAGYAAVTTGSHPEYHTAETLNALHAYRQLGGNFLYLGGNGFYWKIAAHPEGNDAIEIRRAEGGIRAWAAEPGEYYHAFDGAYGGLWRRNNRPPQQLAGVGFSAQGTFLGSHYRRRKETFTNQEIAWIFEGIDEEVLGDFGLSGGGAAGFELDRADTRLGSPPDLHLLAVSENHADTFVPVPEEILTHQATWPGEPPEKLIRADMVYHVNANGGQLFSAGSITFCGSLLHNNGDNNISKLLLNVVTRFTRRGGAFTAASR